MRPHHIIHVSGIAAFLAVASSAILAYAYPSGTVAVAAVPSSQEATTSTRAVVEALDTVNELPTATSSKQAKFGLPMVDALERVTKKTFGLEVHPETSPVANDRFNGFHVGVDFETFETEQAIDIPVSAICDGPLFQKQFAKGYGGYALQSCRLNGERVTVLYGHLDLESVRATSTSAIKRGETIGVLGEGYSKETDGVRKHL
ncbi:hypothetical protein IT087_02730, partial [Candidatus Uhrbacteria bacterium]|nr:hypothetical protein [Candidatus Uhrbacteria bacterium]